MNLKIAFVCILAVGITAYFGSLFTAPSIASGWYEIIKPDIAPPNFVFPIVWTVLYLMISASMYLVWINTKEKVFALAPYVINLFLNALWSYVFFGLQDIFLAMVVVIGLWISIAVMIYESWRINKWAGLILIPYLVWVGFASLLNFIIWMKTG